MSHGLDDVEGVDRFSLLLYSGDKSTLQIVTELGWAGVASLMGTILMQKVLQQSISVYSIFFVSQVLHHLIDSHFGISDLVGLETFLSSVIVERYRLLNPLSVDTLNRLLCSVVRKGFCDAPELQGFPLKVAAALKFENNEFLEDHISLSCSILINLIDEMESTKNASQNLVKYKCVNTSFRNKSLLPVFQAASYALKRLLYTHEKANYSVVLLLKRILIFDFTCSLDEIAEDVMTREFPHEWSKDLVDQELFSRLWELYSTQRSDEKFYCAVLETLTPLISLKSSLYSSRQQQNEWMNSILLATLSIMESRLHLEEPIVLREFCRLLNRVKPNFSIEDMRKSSCYDQWVRAVTEFTKLCFQNWHHARQTFLSLTSIWAKLVGSQSYCKDGHTQFDIFAPDVCISYMKSNREQAISFAKDEATTSFEDYILDADSETLALEFEFASQLLRFCGEEAENYVIQEISSSLDIIKIPNTISSLEFSCICERLAWIISLVSYWMGAYRFSRNSRALDSCILRVCLDATKWSCQFSIYSNVSTSICRHFHKSILAFLRSAWHIILLDRMEESKNIREELQKSLGLESQNLIGSFLLELLINEVRECVFLCPPDVGIEALNLLNEMSQSPSTAVILQSLPQFNSNFLLNIKNIKISKNVVPFHRVRFLLSRIQSQVHFLHGNSESFWNHILPQLLEELKECLNLDNMINDINFESLTAVICSWRGVFRSCVGQNEYKILLRKISPFLPILMEKIKTQLGTICGIQLIRLINEITENRCRRINFGSNGVDGYYLFRYVSESLEIQYHLIIKALESNDSKLEEWGIKCMRILLSTGRNILTGGYCNLGVLRLYEDKSLIICLTSLWRIMMLVNSNRLCHYEKLAKSYLMLTAEIFKDLYLWFLCVIPIREILSVIYLLEFSIGFYISNATCFASLGVEALGVLTTTLIILNEENLVQSEQLRISLLECDGSIFSRLLRLTLDFMVSKKCSSSVAEILLRNLIALDRESFNQLTNLFSRFTISAGKEMEVRDAFTLLGASACDSVQRNNNTLFAKEFRHFSTVITSCLN